MLALVSVALRLIYGHGMAFGVTPVRITRQIIENGRPRLQIDFPRAFAQELQLILENPHRQITPWHDDRDSIADNSRQIRRKPVESLS
jgi:hypothetical protein